MEIQNSEAIQGRSVGDINAPAHTSRSNNFDFLRLILAILVIFSHSFVLGPGPNLSEPFLTLTRGRATGGIIAVNFFFIMSGYLITASYLRSTSIFDYLGKRVRRIYPGFIGSMLFAALVVVPISGAVITGGNAGGKILNFVWNTLRLQEFSFVGAFSKNPLPDTINGSVWTITVEFKCYLGLLLLGVSRVLQRRKLMTGIFLVSIVVGVMFNVLGLQQIKGATWTRLIPMYLAGVIAYLYRDKIRYTWQGGLASFCAMVASCFVPFSWAAVFPIAGTYLLFWIAFNPYLHAYHAAKFGDFSYGTYLYAFPVQQMIMNAWGMPINPLALFVQAAPLTLVLAVASWHFIERPFLKSGRPKQPVLRPVIATQPSD